MIVSHYILWCIKVVSFHKKGENMVHACVCVCVCVCVFVCVCACAVREHMNFGVHEATPLLCKLKPH